MDDNPSDLIKPSKRVTFDPSIPDEDPESLSSYKKDIMRKKQQYLY